MDAIYDGGSYNFYYAALCAGEPNVQPRRDSLNNHTVPTCYFDAGDTVLVGGYSNLTPYINFLDLAGSRQVPEIDLSVSLTYNAKGTITVDVSATLNTFINLAPDRPSVPAGVTQGNLMTEYTYTSSTTDPEEDQLWYRWSWGDGDTTLWLGPYESGAEASASHSWSEAGDYYIKVQAKDENDAESFWSGIKFTHFEGLPYICGDANSDETVNISDAVYIINYVFVGGTTPDPLEAGDANCDATVNVSDAVWIINYVFVGGNAPCDSNGDTDPDC
ncbi:MAG TPA: PKD domain-containing protein [candidate division Zixibacteria bacterium]|nr:PKD domain-containing protein [candidate division Zixibacteria bacterium]HER00371.1 PKD domain-containing protein [candidate division Zixibacteria bacterium]